MAMPTVTQWIEGIQWVMKKKAAELVLIYNQPMSQEEMIVEITPAFHENYTAFGDDVLLQALIDSIKADLERPEEINTVVTSVLGITPTNDEIDQIVAQLNAAKT